MYDKWMKLLLLTMMIFDDELDERNKEKVNLRVAMLLLWYTLLSDFL